MTAPSQDSDPSSSTVGLATALVGAWRLESTRQRLANGTVQPSPLYGRNGVGYLIYSASGQMCAILADPSRESWTSEDEPTEKDLQSLYAHFIAYCGRYEVEEQQGLVHHHIELHVTPNCIGTVFKRRATVDGARLTLYVVEEQLPANVLEYKLTWLRMDGSASVLPRGDDAA